MKILEPKPPGTLWATQGLLRESFLFTFLRAQIVEIQIIGRLENNRIKNILKEVVVAYLKCCSTICLAGFLSTYGENFLLAWIANLERQKDFMGTKICRNHSEIFIRPLTKTSRSCRLLCVGSIVSRKFSFGNFRLQVADVLERM